MIFYQMITVRLDIICRCWLPGSLTTAVTYYECRWNRISKFPACVVDSCVSPLVDLREFLKKFEMSLIELSGTWGRWFVKKPDVEFLWHCPFKHSFVIVILFNCQVSIFLLNSFWMHTSLTFSLDTSFLTVFSFYVRTIISNLLNSVKNKNFAIKL